MNLLFRFLAVGTLLTAAHAFAVEAFEGKVTLTMTDDKSRSHDMSYVMKGHKLRMDMTGDKADAGDDSEKEHPKKHRKLLPGFLGGKPADSGDTPPAADSGKPHQVSTIMDMEKMEMIMLMPEQNMYMVMPIKKAVDKAVEHAEKVDSHTDVVRTGKTEKILGYSCDQILVTDTEKKTVTEMWVAPNLGMFMGLGSGQAGGGGGGMFGGHKSATAAKWEEALKGKSGFPMRVISRDNAGKETFRMEATKIEPGDQPDALFVPPPGYQKFQMPDLGSLFRQG